MKRDLTGKPGLLKEINIGLIKDALSKHGQATRVELAALTNISQPTVNLLIKELLEEETIISLGTMASTGGRRAESYTLNQKKSAIALVVTSNDSFEIAVADMNVTTEADAHISLNKELSYTEQLTQSLEEIIAQYPNIGAIAIGVPGAVTETGEVFAIPQIPEWEHSPLKDILEKRLNLPVVVSNDINSITVGYLASQEQVQNLVYIHLEGCGIGAGIIIDGKLYPGRNSFAGELGYMKTGENSAEEILAAASQKNTEERKHKTVTLLADILVNMICILNPEKILLGGNDLTEWLPQIQVLCKNSLPAHVIPPINIMEQERKHYFKGLGKLGLQLLNQDIQIVRRNV